MTTPGRRARELADKAAELHPELWAGETMRRELASGLTRIREAFCRTGVHLPFGGRAEIERDEAEFWIWALGQVLATNRSTREQASMFLRLARRLVAVRSSYGGGAGTDWRDESEDRVRWKVLTSIYEVLSDAQVAARTVLLTFE